ncbi:MAG: MBL fold metallo-hydrolase, partial [Actinomycetota bacterium]|nr:MBL fold metallo-hydrolase [Actinomycetota bacterium]
MSRLPVRRIVMDTPYPVGPVNAYLIEAEPLTIVDAGINTPESQNAMVLALTAAGYFVESIERILITHAHPDHYGLVPYLQEISGATVYFPEREIARVRDRQMLFEVGRLLVEAGMPLELLFKMDQQRKKDPAPRVPNDEVVPVRDGDTFAFHTDAGAFDLRALLMPGHTGGHVVYWEQQTKTMFAGDQLLPDVSPNPLLEPSLDEPGTRRRSLEEYLASLEEMATMGIGLAYPGHGSPVTEPQRLIESTIEHHLKRKAAVARLLGPVGKTPYEIASDVYPNVTGYDSFLAVSEIVAHLDLVVHDGDAVVEERDGVTYYLAA